MSKRRVTLNLDGDVVADTAHRVALTSWLDELDAEHGAASETEVALARTLIEELEAASSESPERVRPLQRARMFDCMAIKPKNVKT